MKNFPSSAVSACYNLRDDVLFGCTLQHDIFLVVCWHLCAKVLSARSNEHFL